MCVPQKTLLKTEQVKPKRYSVQDEEEGSLSYSNRSDGVLPDAGTNAANNKVGEQARRTHSSDQENTPAHVSKTAAHERGPVTHGSLQKESGGVLEEVSTKATGASWGQHSEVKAQEEIYFISWRCGSQFADVWCHMCAVFCILVTRNRNENRNQVLSSHSVIFCRNCRVLWIV